MNDDDLRRRFTELAKRDQNDTPDFHAMWTAARPRRSPWRFVVPAASMAAAAMFLLWCGARTMLLETSAPMAAAPSPASVDDRVTLDPAPLDFLLDVRATSALAATSGLDPNPIRGW